MRIAAFVFLFMLSAIVSFGQSDKLFLSIGGSIGRHNIEFVSIGSSPGLSFGLSVEGGIYATHHLKYKGGLYFNYTDAASRNVDRRAMSESFVLPNPKFDKHIIFNFAQFRASNIGWFSEYELKPSIALFHRIGFGIFGTTERDQLYDFALHHEVGTLLGSSSKFRVKLGLVLDHTFGTGNPNYKQSNIALVVGGIVSI